MLIQQAINCEAVIRAYSSVGRAPVLHTGGHRFESCCAQHYDNYAGVVQLVRAPACHVGSCGFESRLPRTFNKCALVIITIMCLACNNQSNHPHNKIKALNVKLLSELNSIQQYEDIHYSKAKLTLIYTQIAHVLVEVYQNPKIEKLQMDESENLELSEKIQERLYQLYEMDGRFRDVLEECQEEGYKILRKVF